MRGYDEVLDDEAASAEELEAAEFLCKMDHEGGLVGLLEYGGPDYFPEELQGQASAFATALETFDAAVDAWHSSRGVSY